MKTYKFDKNINKIIFLSNAMYISFFNLSKLVSSILCLYISKSDRLYYVYIYLNQIDFNYKKKFRIYIKKFKIIVIIITD